MRLNLSYVTKLNSENAHSADIGGIMNNTLKQVALAAMVAAVPSATAQTGATSFPELKPLAVAQVEGTYAGTFLCSLGEMGMTLTLKDTGAATSAEDIGQMHCKSGAGPCNDRQDAEIKDSRKVEGVINFFPTVGNPEAPSGAFEVSGSVNYAMKTLIRLRLEPGAWLDQADNFGSAGMTGTLYRGTLNGKPTERGCHDLMMTKIQTWAK